MFANSWLYHYYSVQSKIQFGIPYEGPARVPASTTPYFHHSPTLPTHPYVTSHHMPYGYHSPVGIASQGSPGLVSSHNGNGSQLNHYHNSGEHYRPYAYRIDAASTQPVDYSPTPNSNNNQIEPRCSSANSSNGSNHTGSPPSKRRAIARLEPLYIPEQQQESSSDASIPELQYQHTQLSDGGTIMVTTVGLPRHRTHSKAMQTTDPADFMDQWNPSPPWSETTQKVPDMVQQELSPYLARTPPTPTSAPPPSTNGHAFSFDWMPEQFVPIMDYTHTTMAHDDVSIPLPVQMVHWPAEHKLLNVHVAEKLHDDDNSNGE